jgi:hypothetical protein
MSDAIITTQNMNAIEGVLVGGDLSRLTPEQRVQYYRAVCQSLDLNPLTRPFDYITLSGKLTLYARKDCAEQLRNKRQISIDKPEIRFEDDWIIVTVCAHIDGRTDSDVGAVKKTDMQGNFGNALMKAVTKAKRRVTLSICGLGMLDETEVETIPDAKPVVVTETGEIVNGNSTPVLAPTRSANTNAKPPAWNPVNALVDAGICENASAAAMFLNKHVPAEYKMPNKLLSWARVYRAWRDAGETVEEAVKLASGGSLPEQVEAQDEAARQAANE